MAETIWTTPISGPLPEGWWPPSNETLREHLHHKQLGIVASSAVVLHREAMSIPEDAITSRQTKEVVDKLFRIAEAKREAGGNLVGLAAPQIGIDASIFLADLSGSPRGKELGDLTAFINPQIEPRGEAMHTCHEGCFSCTHIFGEVDRAARVEMKAWLASGSPIEIECDQMAAHVLQHERAHLLGKLFPNEVIARGGILNWRPLEERREYAQYVDDLTEGKDVTWPYTIPYVQWQAMQEGTYSFDDFRLTA